MSGFYVGQKVVCVNDFHYNTDYITFPNGLPRKGDVCTVAGYCTIDGLLLVEYPSPSLYGYPIGFRPERFRPIDSLTEQMDRIEEEGAPVELEPEYA